MKRKILFVGMVNSPHAARWIELIADEGWDLHFFPVYHATPHPLLRNITIHHPWISFGPRRLLKNMLSNIKAKLLGKEHHSSTDQNKLKVCSVYPIPVISKLEQVLYAIKTKPLGESDVRAQFGFDPNTLAHLIKKLKPDLIHSFEFQHAGYTVLRSKDKWGNTDFPQWLATNWGSDIYYYQQFPDHKKQIARLLQSIDHYSCECNRDIQLAEQLGIKTQHKALLPNTGGFDIDHIASLRSAASPSKRRIMMIKGYQHFAGRALTALDALVLCADILKEYRIVIYSASVEIHDRVQELQIFSGMNIVVFSPLQLSHEKMLQFFANARVYLGVSISDAISTSMLEAMAMGAFPIQTNTSCCDEWIKDGESGFSIPADDPHFIAMKIREALTNDELVDKAAEMNWKVIQNRADKNKIRDKEKQLYNDIFAKIGK